jgi:hypothetical protein
MVDRLASEGENVKRAVATVTALAGAATTEFLVATLPAVPLPGEPGGVLLSQVIIDGFINYTPGTLGTSVTVRVRRSTIGGTLVGVAQVVTTVAAAAIAIPISAADPLSQTTPPTIPGQVYVVTMQNVAGSGAGTVNYAVITATTS